jgi:hypothetical protein
MPPKSTMDDSYQANEFPNKDILLAKKKTTQGPKKVVEIQPVLSKSVLRKMAKIAREKESKKHRLHSLEILQEHQFDGDKRVLFQQSGTIGTIRTKAEELAHLYGLQQAGVELDESDRKTLQEALVDLGDVESSHALAQKKKQSISSHAFKTITANPFMPLSTASATINATIQDRLLGSQKNGQKKVYSAQELKTISENMKINEFDVSYTKKIKKRQRREEHALVNDKLKELNSKKIHEMKKDYENDQNNQDDLFKPEQLIVLPKELRGLTDILSEQSGGKVRAVTSKVSGGQLYKPKNDSASPEANQDNNDGFRAAAHLISKGLLTTKSKDKIDVLFDMGSFSDSDMSDDDNGGNNNDKKDTKNKQDKKQPLKKNTIEEDLWGVTSREDKEQNKIDKKQKVQEQLQKAKLFSKRSAPIEDEFVSAAAAVAKKPIQIGPQQPMNDNDDDDDNDNSNPNNRKLLPKALAMPTITRTNQAAAISRTIPIAVLGGNMNNDQPVIIVKKTKQNPNGKNFDKRDDAITNGFSENEFVQLQKKEKEFSVNFQVLKSRKVRDFLQAVHEGNNADMSDVSDDDNNDLMTTNIYGSNNTTQKEKEEEGEDKPKKRKILFDFTQPITVDASKVVRSTLVVDSSTLMQDSKPLVVENDSQSKKVLNKAIASINERKPTTQPIKLKKSKQISLPPTPVGPIEEKPIVKEVSNEKKSEQKSIIAPEKTTTKTPKVVEQPQEQKSVKKVKVASTTSVKPPINPNAVISKKKKTA